MLLATNGKSANVVKLAGITVLLVTFVLCFQYGLSRPLLEPFSASKRGVEMDPLKNLSEMVQDSPTVWMAVQFDVHMLLLIHTFKGTELNLLGKTPTACIYNNTLRAKDSLKTEIRTKAFKIESDWTVVCTFPEEEDRPRLTEATDVTLEVDGLVLPTVAKYPNRENWKNTVYFSVIVEDKLLIFAKGLRRKSSRNPSDEMLKNSSCVFGENLRTRVLSMCLENIICELPPEEMREELRGKPVGLIVGSRKFLTALLFNPDSTKDNLFHENMALLGVTTNSDVLQKENSKVLQVRGRVLGKKHKLCACTMVWNSARFLREWVVYHGRIGVSRFFFYDNNSDDDLEDEVSFLRPYNLTRHPWPWLKTQEAGFSHCAIRAEKECEWMIYIDVDEFIYPKKLFLERFGAIKSDKSKLKPETLPQTSQPILERLIEDFTSNFRGRNKSVGQLKFACRNFGPSGLEDLPSSGQMVNYICRESKKNRKKSMVFLEALKPTRCGVIHYFDLKENYVNQELKPRDGAINHYKYQVWKIFETRYHRRVATYVFDWRHMHKKPPKLDLPAGLGYEPIEPKDWKSKFCAVNDTALRDHVEQMFPLTNGKLPWERD